VSEVAGCYWSEGEAPLASSTGPLPAAVDVLVIGSGYTGLAAARETALAGRSTLVVDAGPIGGGCSSRNGGQVAFSIKPAHATLAARHGVAVADGIYREGVEAVDELRHFAATGEISCDWRESGCFVGAHTPRHFEALVREAESQLPAFRAPYEVVPKAEQARAVDSPLYHGGVLYPADAAVHPSQLVRALQARAAAAGVRFRDGCEVRGIGGERDAHEVVTSLGTLRARQVLIATNGYTGAFAPWHRRRVLPIGSYIVATEPLDPAVVSRLIPQGRNLGDTRRVVVYIRPSPDGRRILFGGRAAAGETDLRRCVPRLRAMLAEVFPELARTRITHAWMGFVGFTFDTMPHVGERDGVYYAMGYCGQGVPSGPYYGRRIGLRMAGRPGGDTALWNLSFPARPYYTGRPWFLPIAVQSYRWLDRLGW
jgi:glycine/D-amino acid oxidase-like deaminating enzyme